eukprot:jgi/Psemu1/16771/gm1.16771_g
MSIAMIQGSACNSNAIDTPFGCCGYNSQAPKKQAGGTGIEGATRRRRDGPTSALLPLASGGS